MPEGEFVKDLLFTLEQAYEEAAIELNEQYGLLPPGNPTEGAASFFIARRLGIAMHESLLALNGRALNAEVLAVVGDEMSAGLDEREVLQFAKQMASFGLASSTMQVLLIGTAIDRMRLSVYRAGELLELIRATPLGEIATSYMRRATKLFLAGFDEECVIMCACVVEAAYADRFDDALMQAHGKGRKKGAGYRFDAWEYEAVARVLHTFSTQEGESAERLRNVRNVLVHTLPISDALRAIDALKICATLLDRLFPYVATGNDESTEFNLDD